MAIEKKTIRDVRLHGRRALVRADFNVPMDDQGNITDDTRLRAHLPTINYLLEHGSKVILMSHLGRPKGKPDMKYSLKPVAAQLGELLEQPVYFAADCIGDPAVQSVANMHIGDVLVLENLRFHKEEDEDDPVFARELARLGDLYVCDAFGTAHRESASMVGVTSFLPTVAGFLMEREVAAISGVLEDARHPFVAILGGAKVSDKIGVIENLLTKVDRLLIGGGMANTFLKAKGYNVGDSLLEADKVELAQRLLSEAGAKLVIPVDVVIADAFSNDAKRKTVAANAVPDGWRILDIGPQTVELFRQALADAQTIVWNGPMGVFEMPNFAAGTKAIAQAVAQRTAKGAYSLVGGGDSVAAVEQMGVADKISHISTGGGASLEMLEGKELPGLIHIQDLHPDPDFSTGVVY